MVLKEAPAGDRREATADDSAAFKFDSVTPGIPYEVAINVKGFSSWTSPSIVLQPSQFFILNNIHLKIEGDATSITVNGSSSMEEIAAEQVHLEEQQRVFGFIPNFYAVYDGANAAPLTTKLKFKLALRVATDPVTIMGVVLMSGIDQAVDRPNYAQGERDSGSASEPTRPVGSVTFCSEAPFCHLYCIRIHATFTRAQAGRAPASSMRWRRPLFAVVTTAIDRSTFQASEAT